MAKRVVKVTAKRKGAVSARPATKRRKVTYSLPDGMADELDRRSAGSERSKSRMVAEALAFYFSAQDRQALAVVYGEAAEDALFNRDNADVLRDFALLDREVDEPSP
jgi:hypothetical protein